MICSRRFFAILVAAWLVGCPVAFALPSLTMPACHGHAAEALDCCQPLAPSVVPIAAAPALLPSTLQGVDPTSAPSPVILGAPTSARPAPPAGWGRLYLSLGVLLN